MTATSTLPPPSPSVPPATLRGPVEPTPPRRGVRIAWLVPGALLAIAALGWGTFNVLSLLAHDERTERLTLPVDGVTTLDVQVDSGTIAVTASDTDEIVVRADISDGWARSDVTTRVVGDVAEVRGRCPELFNVWCKTTLTIEVPADMRVVVDGSHDTVTVTGVIAAVTVDNDHGRIELVDVSGPIVATNEHGRIEGRRLTSSSVDARNDHGRVELSFLAPPEAVTVRTTYGRVELVVPDAADAYRVETASRFGSTDTLIRTDPSSPRTIDVTSDHGSITIRPPG